MWWSMRIYEKQYRRTGAYLDRRPGSETTEVEQSRLTNISKR